MDRRIRITRRLAIATAIGMFVVLLMGARVTATGSGEGCGNDWPLCHGGFLPADTFESITEYSHRLVTGIEGILVVATAVYAWTLRKPYPEVKVLMPLMVFTLVLQSLMGAAAVKWPTSPEIMASHFGISILCLAAAALLARVLNERRDERRGEDLTDAYGASRRSGALRAFQFLAIAGVVLAVIVAYSGAYVRHSGAELACTSWPTCNGKLVPKFGGLQGIQTIHRLGALLITLYTASFWLVAYRLRLRRADLMILANAAILLVVAQSLVGAIVVESGLQLLATLAHAGVMALYFVVMCDAVRISWRDERAHPRVGAPKAYPGMAVGD